MDSEKLFGWSKLFDENGKLRVKKLLVDGSLHALVGAAVAGGLLAVWHLGPIAIVAAGLVGAVREGIQITLSGHPKAWHLVDRAKDILEFTVGGTIGWLVSLFF